MNLQIKANEISFPRKKHVSCSGRMSSLALSSLPAEKRVAQQEEKQFRNGDKKKNKLRKVNNNERIGMRNREKEIDQNVN